MATSRFQNIRGAFVTLVNARFTTDGITDVDVYGYPPVGNVTREDMVWLERIRSDQEPLSMGGAARQVDEELEVDLQVRAPRMGSDVDTSGEAEARAEAILASIENALRADGTIGGTVLFAELASFESIPDNDADGPIGTIEATITCQANI
jgi:hypothetical protein